MDKQKFQVTDEERKDIVKRTYKFAIRIIYIASKLPQNSLTLLLHKGVVESAAYHHKKAVSAALMIPFKGHYWVDPVDHIDLMAVPLWVRV